MELFSGVADICGEGLPFSFLFIDKCAPSTIHAKQRILERWFTALKAKGIDPEFTLSDKDKSEINALHAVWPTAKHQLCIWHLLRAVRRRLASRELDTNAYDVAAAHALFNFIDVDFLPTNSYDAKKVSRQFISDYMLLLVVLAKDLTPSSSNSTSSSSAYSEGAASSCCGPYP
jgi:hypothetical protein